MPNRYKNAYTIFIIASVIQLLILGGVIILKPLQYATFTDSFIPRLIVSLVFGLLAGVILIARFIIYSDFESDLLIGGIIYGVMVAFFGFFALKPLVQGHIIGLVIGLIFGFTFGFIMENIVVFFVLIIFLGITITSNEGGLILVFGLLLSEPVGRFYKTKEIRHALINSIVFWGCAAIIALGGIFLLVFTPIEALIRFLLKRGDMELIIEKIIGLL